MPRELNCPRCARSMFVDRQFERYSSNEALQCPQCGTVVTVRFSETAALLGGIAGSVGALVAWMLMLGVGLDAYADGAALLVGLGVMLLSMYRRSFILLPK